MKMYNITYINQDKTTEIKEENGVPYIVFKNLELPFMDFQRDLVGSVKECILR